MASDYNQWARPGSIDASRRPPAIDLTGRPRFTAASEDLLTGARALHTAFNAAPVRSVERGVRLPHGTEAEPQTVRVYSGFAYRASGLADGGRAIVDILIPYDFIGIDQLAMAHSADEVVAASRLAYRALPVAEIRRLMAQPAVALHLMALLSEARWRAHRLAVSIGRLDAQARICLMLVDLYDRLRRRELIARPTFNLPLTQEQMADHLGLTVVHVNRTLRRLREEKLVIVDRQVVIIIDLEGLRAKARGLCAADAAADAAPSPDALSFG